MKKELNINELLMIRKILKKEIESVEAGQKEDLEAIVEKLEININHKILKNK